MIKDKEKRSKDEGRKEKNSGSRLNEIGVKTILAAFDKMRLQDYPNSKGMVLSGENWQIKLLKR